MGIDNPIGFLDLPAELRLQVYKILFGQCSLSSASRLSADPRKSEKNSPEDRENTTKTKRLFAQTKSFGVHVYSGCSPLPLFLSNKQVYLESAYVFYTHNTFYASIELGEKDWQTIYKWLVMIGPQNRKNLRKIDIHYDSLELAPILTNGKPGKSWLTSLGGEDRYRPGDWCKRVTVELSPTWEWVEFISPTIEKIFKLLGECRNVTVTFQPWGYELLDRVLCPELYEAEKGNRYPNSEWFKMTYENLLYSNDSYDMEDILSLLPDLMELYRTRYGGDSISVLWHVMLFLETEETSWRRSMIERSGWDILQFECRTSPPPNDVPSNDVIIIDMKKESKNLQEFAAQSTGDLRADIRLFQVQLTMFIPYRGPSKNKDTNARRAINAFVAVEASSRRRKRRGGEVEHRGRQGTLQWLQIPGCHVSKKATIDERKDYREDNRQERRGPSTHGVVVSRPVGAGRFYPFDGFVSKGPLTARALSYYFDILLPHDAKALGLGEVGTRSFGRGLLSWASKHDLILHGLSAFTLCSLECQDVTGNTSRAIMFHRNKVLLDLHIRLSRQGVDDVLIQGMALLIPIDDYLGHYEFGPVHLKGMREVVKLRGGFDAVGSSDENAFGRNLRMSTLVTSSLAEFHVQTTIRNDPTPLANGEFPHPLPVWEETALDLPPGFRDLARCGYLSEETIGIVRDFSDWLIRSKESKPTARQTWRCSMSRDLNNLEKCICVTLACLADDLSAMGTHPAALIFRKPQRRAEVLAAVAEVWNDPLLIKCVIWMCTVIATPQNPQIISRDKQRQLLRKSILQRYSASNWNDIQPVLQRFFYDSSRENDWIDAWNMALAGLPDMGTRGIAVAQHLPNA
ncbi:hypothetical protein CNMCM5793_000657 [Aspergillus hiratsukae]|uniref:F-box domain-containing protein n=1 Tax=Aspergillus hiratsukae TaxID=1194566 RepID=A0A8H6PAC5_9EURO|nr:hypothetical protein CNMCM5793_000657 [Aspergillus hiratsukae]KAF7163022.1 hypothetical protein CNMCM6106_000107 [Aspergillus hiratsukae]